MAGRTNMVVGYWNQRFTHIPMALVAARRKQLDPQSTLWCSVLEATGQPTSMVGTVTRAR
jgi:6-phosphofructokinase 1